MRLSKETAHLYSDRLYKDHLNLKKRNKQLSVSNNKLKKIKEYCKHYINDILIIEVDKIPLNGVLKIINEEEI